MPENKQKKKIIIVGAGVSGLTAGIYALDNGFDVEIYEKHSLAGGECTGWTRYGTYIDGCAHWIVGTDPCSPLYPLWEHVGIFDNNTKVYPTEYLCKMKMKDGRYFTFWSDLDKLKKEMMDFFPEDKANIRSFIRTVREYQFVNLPVKKPFDMMNPFELALFGISMLPMAIPFANYKHISIKDYVTQFENPELGRLITRFTEPIYNIHSFFYICQSMSKGEAGVLEGGSLAMAERIVSRFENAGGKLYLSHPVKRILTENNVAVGVELPDGSVKKADYVIAASDVTHTLNVLLEGKYHDKGFEEQFYNRKANPINTSIMLAYKTKHDMDLIPKMLDYDMPETNIFGKKLDHFGLRNFAFDKSLKSVTNETLLTVLLPADEVVYDTLKAMDRNTYQSEKKKLGEYIRKQIILNMGIKDEEIDCIDVVTPLTYERYCNAYKGSYMSYITTEYTKGLMRPGLIKGLDHFALATQWIMPPGGLPVALMAGKHAVQRICKMAKQKFVNKEMPRSVFLNSKKLKLVAD